MEAPTPPSERADAARNRARILDAAARLFATHGVENVSMDAVAREAKVGKGTLFRRFGDRAGLATALLDARERDLQEAFIRGAPPLGPGAPPAQRLAAFVTAYVQLLESSADLLLAAETGSRPGTRYRSGAYAAWHQHVAMLLAQTGTAEDPETAAHVLLAALSADLFTFLARTRRISVDRVTRAVLAATPGSGAGRTGSRSGP